MTYVYDDVTYAFYNKTVVSVNAPSARVTEGVPINNTLSLWGVGLRVYGVRLRAERMGVRVSVV